METTAYYYNFVIHDLADPRSNKWLMLSDPGPMLLIIAAYLYFCISLGPRIMKDRKPFELKRTIMVYNVFQIAFSMFMVYETLVAGWWRDYRFSCHPVDHTDNPKAVRMARACWWYFIGKFFELFDTVFFVLRKKDKQISFLHLFHHASMPINSWIGAKYYPGGHETLVIPINSAIHVVMYFYYFVSALGPQYQKYIWWKKHLTTFQLVQFLIIFWQNIVTQFEECNFPRFLSLIMLAHATLFLYMFGSFYVSTYMKNKDKSANKEMPSNGSQKIKEQ